MLRYGTKQDIQPCGCTTPVVSKTLLCIAGNWLKYTFGESRVAVISASVQDKVDKLKG